MSRQRDLTNRAQKVSCCKCATLDLAAIFFRSLSYCKRRSPLILDVIQKPACKKLTNIFNDLARLLLYYQVLRICITPIFGRARIQYPRIDYAPNR